ncbi:hypothetical protein L226DRAFT_574562 [Lentinus tigrinus ALCF2SS1-7]|uniref:F-box domain-containing protein n=1 Tax=Lentinus tigrinus ALCF2SS1-6 TaxID=1328759 RepID=A0A5C2RUV3_9APHY|nr:hypothetical protein L227DRAFT_615327 [Lentinus tigrinus ALCF2SS1-6]RPD70677.1 hypothetical protein L226DRAFT_574562 [Lentinus tigrinus ALCF2SS1-7]
MTTPPVAFQIDPEDSEDKSRLPDVDLALFTGLRPSQTREVALARVKEYEAEIVKIQRYIRDLYFFHNAALPIHSKLLSHDLLANVFNFICPTYRSAIRGVMHVCRSWRHAALSATAFWAALSGLAPWDNLYFIKGGNRHQEFLPSFIERSAPLSFRLYVKGNDPVAIQPALKVHSSRVSLLSFFLDGRYLDALRNLLLLDMPSLESITLAFACSYGDDGLSTEQLHADLISLPQSSHRHPRLHTLHIDGCLVCPMLMSGSIRTLHIKTTRHTYYHGSRSKPCIAGRVLSSDLLLDSLQQCPLLEELVLQTGTSPWAWQAMSASPGRSCYLPNLRRCTINEENTQFQVRTFLEYVHMPPTTNLSVTYNSSPLSHLLPDTPTSFVTALTTLHLQIDRPVVHDPGSVRHRTPCSVIVNGFVRGSEGRLSMTVSYPHWSDDASAQPPRSQVLREVVQSFAPSQAVRELTLQLDPGIMVVRADWDFVLDAFRQLTKLTVHIDSCRRLVRTLCLPRVCPELETIAIHCSNGRGMHENVVSMAECRVARGTPLRRFEFHQKPRHSYSTEAQKKSTPLSAKRLARLQAFIPEVVTSPMLDDVL